MKTWLLSICCLLGLSHMLCAQSILNPEWIRQVYSLEDGSSEAWDLDIDQDGFIYWPVSIDSLNNGVDIYCYKYNESGEPLWDTPFQFDAIGGQFAFAVNAKSDDLYIGGRECLINGFSCDMQLLKIDKITGVLEWDRLKDFGNNGYDEIDGLEVKEDGIYCGGWAQAIQEGPYQIDIGLWKLDFDGNTNWSNHLGEPETAEHQDGHFVVTDDHIYAGGLYEGTGIFNLYNGTSYIAKFSRDDGSLVDMEFFGPQSDMPFDIENVLGMTSDGTHFYLTGYTTPESFDQWETFVAKFDEDLNLVWLTNWGGSGSESARGIKVHDGKIYVAGLTESPEFSSGEADALLLMLDTDGNYLSHHTWGGIYHDSFRDVAIYNGAVYLSGTTGVAGLSTGESISGNLLKVNLSDLVGVEETSLEASEVVLYPNPSPGKIAVELAYTPKSNCQFSVLNSLGQKVYSSSLKDRHNIIELTNLSGVYTYHILVNNSEIQRGKLIMQ